MLVLIIIIVYHRNKICKDHMSNRESWKICYRIRLD
jgi:hypothetical protein